jgi:hypothetical protein
LLIKRYIPDSLDKIITSIKETDNKIIIEKQNYIIDKLKERRNTIKEKTK